MFLEDTHYQEIFSQRQAIRQRLEDLQRYAGHLGNFAQTWGTLSTPFVHSSWELRGQCGLHPAVLAIFQEREKELVSFLSLLSMLHTEEP